MTTKAAHNAWWAWKQTYSGKMQHEVSAFLFDSRAPSSHESYQDHIAGKLLSKLAAAHEAGFTAGETHGKATAAEYMQEAARALGREEKA